MNAAFRPNFQFDFDVDVFEKSSAGTGKERRIGGYVSTEDMDQQGEVLIQEGLDFTHFLSKGWFNDNHSRDTTGIVGYPEMAEMRERDGKKGWYVEGYLLKGTEKADQIWELANALQKSGRRLGYSVEGKIHERQGGGKVVARALVKNVAITNCPVNDKTNLEVLAKSLTAFEKAMGMGTGGVGIAGGINHGDAATGYGAGQVLVAESLDSGRRKKRKKKRDGLSKAAGVAWLMTVRPKLTLAEAKRAYAHAYAQRLAQ